jgi:hypothetical protein
MWKFIWIRTKRGKDDSTNYIYEACCEDANFAMVRIFHKPEHRKVNLLCVYFTSKA